MTGLIEIPSPNHDSRNGHPVSILVLHYTGMVSAEAALTRLCDPSAQVSAHYLIDEDGATHQLVNEDRRAWHAGEAYWRGARDINARSIGIELVNPGHAFGYRPFPPAQMAAATSLCAEIIGRTGIAPRNILGHSDVAPRRKQDPGELFDWQGLARAGIGLWPESPQPSDRNPHELLAEIGYETEDMAATLCAFQRRYRPSLIDGVLDAQTAGLIAGLRALIHAKATEH